LRVAALAFGILAGLVASLILALGGLDVPVTAGATADRQAQAIRFGLFVIGNLGIFGAALALAVPLAGAVFLLLGAVAWVGAALLMRHSTDLVLITPPALLLVAAIFAVIAHFRRPRTAEDEEPDVEIIAPERGDRRPSDLMDDEAEVGMPAFAAEQRPEPSARGAFDDSRRQPKNVDWNPRRRQPPPPRAKPAFRPIEDEYEDDEPSGFSRFALGLSGILSFGLYAALAGAAVLIVWTVRNEADVPAATVAEAPAVSSTAELPPFSSASSEQDRLPSTEATLEPILTGEPIREVETAGTAPSTSPSELVADAATSQEQAGFGQVTLPDGPVMIPTLSDDFNSDDVGTPLPPVSAAPPSLPAEEASSEEPTPLDLENPPVEPSVAAPGQPLPRAIPPQMAALRTAPGTGPTVVATRPANTNNTGL
jgi:hypothetical protein